MKKDLLNRVELNPDVMLGKPVIRGTRLPVEIILEKLAFGATEEEILKDYPFLDREDIKAALYYAAKVISMEEEYAMV